MLHHGTLLGVEFGAVRALKHMDFLLGQVSIKVHVEQGLLSEDCVTHHTLVDHSAKRRNRKQ